MRCFTKSVFKEALACPARLNYCNRPEYANQNIDDPFLMSLAEGGFQVGELAKVYYGVTDDCDLAGLGGYEKPLAQTQEMLRANRVTIAEAAFKSGNLFVRADIVAKDGPRIDLVEVKAKSWETGKPFTHINRRGEEVIEGEIAEYAYDVAFQKYVLQKAMPGCRVRAFLMMADKTKTADVAGINQCFRIRHANGRTKVERSDLANGLAAHEHVLTAFDVDELCEKIIGDRFKAQAELLSGMSFTAFVEEMARRYCGPERHHCDISTKCFSCPYRKDEGDSDELRDGYKECWKAKAGFTDDDFKRPLLGELWGNRGKLFARHKYFLSDIRPDDFAMRPSDKPGLAPDERRIVQIALATNRPELLGSRLTEGLISPDIYVDIAGLRAEMSAWKYPLHMIDFETTCVALPFYANMRPYEQIAFQFSHHTISRDGKIAHAGQYINMRRGVFPNFEFVRALKANLENDDGSVFRYSHHENSILNAIRVQLLDSHEPDRDELVAFIESITHRDSEDGTGRIAGARDMVDLCDVVRRYYYHRSMKGSNSIKVVLPAILNSSKRIQAKYAKPIYGGGAEIASLNIVKPEPPHVWVTMETGADGKRVVANPYKTLPAVSSYFPVVKDVSEAYMAQRDEGLESVNNGGAALSAYGLIQFSDEDSDRANALKEALLRYCELDTLAMVFIWEYFHEMTEAR